MHRQAVFGSVQALRHCVNSRDAKLSIASVTTFWWHWHLPEHGYGKSGQHFHLLMARLAAPAWAREDGVREKGQT